eukprot:jgi/Tetstr1/436384/TSEL_025217.t1
MMTVMTLMMMTMRMMTGMVAAGDLEAHSTWTALGALERMMMLMLRMMTMGMLLLVMMMMMMMMVVAAGEQEVGRTLAAPGALERMLMMMLRMIMGMMTGMVAAGDLEAHRTRTAPADLALMMMTLMMLWMMMMGIMTGMMAAGDMEARRTLVAPTALEQMMTVMTLRMGVMTGMLLLMMMMVAAGGQEGGRTLTAPGALERMPTLEMMLAVIDLRERTILAALARMMMTGMLRVMMLMEVAGEPEAVGSQAALERKVMTGLMTTGMLRMVMMMLAVGGQEGGSQGGPASPGGDTSDEDDGGNINHDPTAAGTDSSGGKSAEGRPASADDGSGAGPEDAPAAGEGDPGPAGSAMPASDIHTLTERYDGYYGLGATGGGAALPSTPPGVALNTAEERAPRTTLYGLGGLTAAAGGGALLPTASTGSAQPQGDDGGGCGGSVPDGEQSATAPGASGEGTSPWSGLRDGYYGLVTSLAGAASDPEAALAMMDAQTLQLLHGLCVLLPAAAPPTLHPVMPPSSAPQPVSDDGSPAPDGGAPPGTPEHRPRPPVNAPGDVGDHPLGDLFFPGDGAVMYGANMAVYGVHIEWRGDGADELGYYHANSGGVRAGGSGGPGSPAAGGAGGKPPSRPAAEAPQAGDGQSGSGAARPSVPTSNVVTLAGIYDGYYGVASSPRGAELPGQAAPGAADERGHSVAAQALYGFYGLIGAPPQPPLGRGIAPRPGESGGGTPRDQDERSSAPSGSRGGHRPPGPVEPLLQLTPPGGDLFYGALGGPVMYGLDTAALVLQPLPPPVAPGSHASPPAPAPTPAPPNSACSVRDAFGLCCDFLPGSTGTDAGGLCCAGEVDDCGVCGGNSACATTVTVTLERAAEAAVLRDPDSDKFLEFVRTAEALLARVFPEKSGQPGWDAEAVAVAAEGIPPVYKTEQNLWLRLEPGRGGDAPGSGGAAGGGRVPAAVVDVRVTYVIGGRPGSRGAQGPPDAVDAGNGGATPPPDAEVRPPTMGEAVARLGQAAVYMAAPAAESSVSYGSTTVVMYSMVLNLAERTGICGNEVCEVGESVSCAADCSRKCPFGYISGGPDTDLSTSPLAVSECSGAGTCDRASGECTCGTGRGGPSCGLCTSDDATSPSELCDMQRLLNSGVSPGGHGAHDSDDSEDSSVPSSGDNPSQPPPGQPVSSSQPLPQSAAFGLASSARAGTTAAVLAGAAVVAFLLAVLWGARRRSRKVQAVARRRGGGGGQPPPETSRV